MSTLRPGTVSKILWHFTGGPLWDIESNNYSKKRKPEKTAFSNLVSILEGSELRVGKFREKIVVDEKQLETTPVCCVADIPIAHLAFHSEKYGRMAIGFKRQSLMNARFNPVFYVKEDKPALLRFHDALSSMQSLDLKAEEMLALTVGDLQKDSSADRELRTSLLESIDQIRNRVDEAAQKLRLLQSFIKTLTEDDFDSIFCEREWRNNSPFRFSPQDVVMIVLPRVGEDGENYHQRFIREHKNRINLYKEIPIVPWEDLVEH